MDEVASSGTEGGRGRAAGGARPCRRRPPLWRRLVGLVVVLGVLLVGGLVVATQTPLATVIAEAGVSKLGPAEVDIGRVRVNWDGHVVAEDVVLRVPGLAGEAGEFFTVRRFELWVNVGAALSGKPMLTRAALVGPRLRLSESVETGRWNIEGLLTGRGRLVVPEFLPALRVTAGMVQVAEHGPAGLRVLYEAPLSGRLTPSDDVAGVSEFELLPAEAAGLTPSLMGTITRDSVTIELGALLLSDWPVEALPTRVRQWYQQFSPSGELVPQRVEITAGREGGFSASVALRGVTLDLPLAELFGDRAPGDGEPLHLRGVEGTIGYDRGSLSAELRGMVEQVPCVVTLRTGGTSVRSPFEAAVTITDFELTGRDQSFRKFLPAAVNDRLASFGHPTGIIDATIKFSRAEEGGRTDFTGRVDLTGGVAAYRRFPYRFHNMAGFFAFDRERLSLELAGDNPSGATLHAVGEFSPLGDDAGVDLVVTARGAPLDEQLRQAIRDAAGDGAVVALDEVFSEPQRQALLAKGVLDPSYTLGGRTTVRIALHREPRLEPVWTREIRVTLEPGAGLLPKAFPYPLVIEDASFFIEEEALTVRGATLRGLAGGAAFVQARVPFDEREDEGADERFVSVVVTDVPLGPLVFGAIPTGDLTKDAAGDPDRVRRGGGAPLDLEAALNGLRLSGLGSARVRVVPREDNASEVLVEAWASGVSSEPGPYVAAVGTGLPNTLVADDRAEVGSPVTWALDGAAARSQPVALALRDADVELRVAAAAGRIDVNIATQGRLEEAGREGQAEPARGTLSLGIPPTPDEPVMLIADAAVGGLDLRAEIERFVAPFDAGVAFTLRELRERHAPAGVVDAAVAFDGPIGRAIVEQHLDVVARPLGPVSGVVGGEAWTLTETAGGIGLSIGREPGLWLEDLRGTLLARGQPAASVGAHGSLGCRPRPVVDPAASDPPPPTAGRGITIDLAGVDLGHPALHTLAADLLGEPWATSLATLRPRGSADATLTLSPATTDPADPTAGPRPRSPSEAFTLPAVEARGSIRPTDLGYTLSGGEVAFNAFEGDIRFDPAGGSINTLTVRADGLEARATGAWTWGRSPGAPALDLWLEYTLDASAWPEGLAASIPGAGPMFAGLTPAIAPGGRLTLREGRLRVVDDSGISFRATGLVGVDRASMRTGVELTNLRGGLTYDVTGRPGMTADYRLEASIDAARVGPVSLSEGRALIRPAGVAAVSEPAPAVLIKDISARVHHGLVTGSVTLSPAIDGASRGPGSGSPMHYEVALNAAAVHAAPLLNELAGTADAGAAPPDGGPAATAPDWSRGTIDGWLAVDGVMNARRRGRGLIEIGGGRVLELPLVTPLIEASNLNLPSAAELNFGEASFRLLDDTLTFEAIKVASATVEIYGYGTLDVPSQRLDLRFHTASTRPIPLVDGLLASVRDEFATIRAVGPVGSPAFALESGRVTRALLGELLGVDPSEREALLDRSRRDAERQRRR